MSPPVSRSRVTMFPRKRVLPPTHSRSSFPSSQGSCGRLPSLGVARTAVMLRLTCRMEPLHVKVETRSVTSQVSPSRETSTT